MLKRDQDSRIQAWAIREMAPWWRRGLARQKSYDVLRRFSAEQKNSMLYRIKNGVVHLNVKPDASRGGALRANLYSDLLQHAVRVHQLDQLDVELLIDVGDARRREDDVPVFVFQKPVDSSEILLPDVDFMMNNFYVSSAFNDHMTFANKQNRAIFVGSTTGNDPITARMVSELSLPRLRSAMYFRDLPEVTWLLPNIAQCDSPSTEQLIRELRVSGNGERVSWTEQCTNKFIISMDGNGATCARVATALRSNSVLLKYDSPHMLYYFPALEPWLHYIPVVKDRDVLEILSLAHRMPEVMAHVARAGHDFATSYLNRRAVLQYTAHLLLAYDASFEDRSFIAGLAHSVAPLGDIMVHVRNTGNRWYRSDGWVGQSDQPLEGFMMETLMNCPFSYVAHYADGSQLSAPGGEYVGTMGMSRAVVGISIDLPGISYAIRVAGGQEIGPVSSGEVAKAPRGSVIHQIRIYT